jgi:hypothetical protein
MRAKRVGRENRAGERQKGGRRRKIRREEIKVRPGWVRRKFSQLNF